jgi:hypothetical protein
MKFGNMGIEMVSFPLSFIEERSNVPSGSLARILSPSVAVIENPPLLIQQFQALNVRAPQQLRSLTS